MATIERDIEGNRWLANESGVYRNECCVIHEEGFLRSGYNWQLDVIETAIALRKEWLSLVAKEQAEREPSVKLDQGAKWILRHGVWYAQTDLQEFGPLPESELLMQQVLDGRREVRARSNPQPINTPESPDSSKCHCHRMFASAHDKRCPERVELPIPYVIKSWHDGGISLRLDQSEGACCGDNPGTLQVYAHIDKGDDDRCAALEALCVAYRNQKKEKPTR